MRITTARTAFQISAPLNRFRTGTRTIHSQVWINRQQEQEHLNNAIRANEHRTRAYRFCFAPGRWRVAQGQNITLRGSTKQDVSKQDKADNLIALWNERTNHNHQCHQVLPRIKWARGDSDAGHRKRFYTVAWGLRAADTFASVCQ